MIDGKKSGGRSAAWLEKSVQCHVKRCHCDMKKPCQTQGSHMAGKEDGIVKSQRTQTRPIWLKEEVILKFGCRVLGIYKRSGEYATAYRSWFHFLLTFRIHTNKSSRLPTLGTRQKLN